MDIKGNVVRFIVRLVFSSREIQSDVQKIYSFLIGIDGTLDLQTVMVEDGAEIFFYHFDARGVALTTPSPSS